MSMRVPVIDVIVEASKWDADAEATAAGRGRET